MLRDLLSKEALYEQANELKKKKFKPGYDGMSMDGAASWIFINGNRLCKDILQGDYCPMPAIGFKTAKTSGGYRRLVRLSAIDSVIQTWLNTMLCPTFEEIFCDNSMAYRPGRGVHTALERYVLLANQKKHVAKLDVSACFDHIDHAILEQKLTEHLQDAETVRLIMSFVNMPLSIDGDVVVPEKGIFQGMPLAPLLCNIYFHSVDMFLQQNGIDFVRYADDIVLFANTLGEASSFLDMTAKLLENELHMICNRKKCQIGSPSAIKYLGHSFTVDKKGLMAYDSDSELRTAYYNWHNERLQNNRGNAEILSDGILRQKDYSIFFDTETVDSEIPIHGVDAINIHSDVIFDTGFLSLTMKNNVAVNVFDQQGELLGTFVPNAPLKAPRLTHEQLLSYYDPERRLAIAKEIVLASIHNSLLNIRYYNKFYGDPKYVFAVNALTNIKDEIKQETEYDKLLLLEARARKIYYGCYDSFIRRDAFEFQCRSRKPPLNMVNSMISFGNTVLYRLIATEIRKTALDVRVGYLHATNTRMNSLNLDLAEIFKPLLVDRVILTLINKGEILPTHFETHENGAVYLTTEGKRIFLSLFYDKLDTVITVKNKKMSYDSVIKEEIRKLIRHFRNKDKYKGFRQVR